MDKYFALIKHRLVEHVVVGSDEFFDHVKDKYDYVVDVTNRTRPSIGDSYYADANVFVNNSVDANIDVNLNQQHLQNGTDDSFEPFQLSKYSVKYDNGTVTIGCKRYSAPGLLDALHKVLIDREKNVHCFEVQKEGPAHGKFGITWDDAEKLYSTLLRIKI